MEKLKLEWRRERGIGDRLWTATVGIFTLGVRDRVTHAEWDIDIRGICGDLERAESVLAAQLAAEAAALDLLTKAVGAFGVEAPGWTVMRDRYSALPDALLIHDDRPRAVKFFGIDPADATLLACALLAAATRAK